MPSTVSPRVHPTVLRIQALLAKIDRLTLPAGSRRDVESILVRQAGKEIDRALPWQAGHGRRTAGIAVKLGQAAGLDAGELHDIKLAALLHDIGLLMLPPRFSRTIEPLEPEAYVAVQNHSRLGANLLEPFSFLREASILIAHHHERWDGTGYPYGIRGEFIPLGARILAIADAFDAIEVPDVSSRERRNTVAARIVMVASGSQFDPALVQLLCRWVGAGREVGDLSLL
jgi:HD-GYP domain-containing protein (c-di-GMP phosphodiesterase class II)